MNKLMVLISSAVCMALGVFSGEAQYDGQADPIVGTWKNVRGTYFESELDEWLGLYRTCFSPDGQVVHYGCRNVDRGTWQRVDENTVTALFDDCTYEGIGKKYMAPSYQVTYTYDQNENVYYRETDREGEFFCKEEAEGRNTCYRAVDFDDYEQPLSFESGECQIREYYADLPEAEEYGIHLEKGLIEAAGDLFKGKAGELERADLPYRIKNVAFYDITGDGKRELFVYVEMRCNGSSKSGAFYVIGQKENGDGTILSGNANFRSGYTEILAPDGTNLLPLQNYDSASSWKGGIRIHLGFRNGQVVVDKEEFYWFHWDYPLLNYVNDYKNGVYCVYAARCERQDGVDGYGHYVDIQESLKIDEESFEPRFVPFREFGYKSCDYPALFDNWTPFDDDWWHDGGWYPEDGEAYGKGMADWIEKAKDDDPNEMLKSAVERSGLSLERHTYPWTAETKGNVTRLLRCPVADYYYASDFYGAAYRQGEVCFYKKNLTDNGDGLEEEWKQVSLEEIQADIEKTLPEQTPLKAPESFTVREEDNTSRDILLSHCNCVYEEDELLVYSYFNMDKKGIFLLTAETEKAIYPLTDFWVDQEQDVVWILEGKENPKLSRIALRKNPYFSENLIMDSGQISLLLAQIYGISPREGEKVFSDLRISLSKEKAEGNTENKAGEKGSTVKGTASGTAAGTDEDNRERYYIQFEAGCEVSAKGYLQSLGLAPLYQEFLRHNLTVENPFPEKGRSRELGIFDEAFYGKELDEAEKHFALYDYTQNREEELLFRIKQTEYPVDSQESVEREVIYVLGMEGRELVCLDIIENLDGKGKGRLEDKEKAEILDSEAAWYACGRFCDIPEENGGKPRPREEAFTAIEQGDFSCVDMGEAYSYIKKEELEKEKFIFRRSDVNKDGVEELVCLLEDEAWDGGMAEYIFAYRNGKALCIYFDGSDGKEWLGVGKDGELYYNLIISAPYYVRAYYACTLDALGNIVVSYGLEEITVSDREGAERLRENYPEMIQKYPEMAEEGTYYMKVQPGRTEEGKDADAQNVQETDNDAERQAEKLSRYEFLKEYQKLTGGIALKERS